MKKLLQKVIEIFSSRKVEICRSHFYLGDLELRRKTPCPKCGVKAL